MRGKVGHIDGGRRKTGASVWLVTTGWVWIITLTAAPPLHARPVTRHHMLMACMSKRMAASRSLSYNDATKLCKAQLLTKLTGPTLASANVAGRAPGGPAR